MSLRTALGILLAVNGYMLIYYRLLVRYFYEEQHGVKEGTFGALFSFPPYSRLPKLGKKYARRYWMALALFISVLLVSAYIKQGPLRPAIGDSPAMVSGANPR